MKVLSIRQPYAWLIAIGCKTIENRTWNRKFRGRFLIHASQAKPEKLDGWQESAMKKYCQEHGIVIPDFKDLPTSAIIGSVELMIFNSMRLIRMHLLKISNIIGS